jgi:hypothetical protein
VCGDSWCQPTHLTQADLLWWVYGYSWCQPTHLTQADLLWWVWGDSWCRPTHLTQADLLWWVWGDFWCRPTPLTQADLLWWVWGDSWCRPTHLFQADLLWWVCGDSWCLQCPRRHAQVLGRSGRSFCTTKVIISFVTLYGTVEIFVLLLQVPTISLHLLSRKAQYNSADFPCKHFICILSKA